MRGLNRLVHMTTFLHKIARATPRAHSPVQETELSKEALVDIVLEVVASADWSQPEADGRLGRFKTPPGEVLLATLTYCYAWGIYSSSKIESAILGNRQNFDLLDRIPLERRSFSQFRRHNRDLVKFCLTQVLGRIGTEDGSRQDSRSSSLPSDFEFARFGHEAAHRIDKALECDFLESDE